MISYVFGVAWFLYDSDQVTYFSWPHLLRQS